MKWFLSVLVLVILNSAIAAQKPQTSNKAQAPAQAQAKPRFPVIQFKVKSPDLFLKDVARLCLSSKDSMALPGNENEVKISDRSMVCAEEIKLMATQWNKETTTKTMAVFSAPDDKPEVEKRISKKYPLVNIESAKYCPCILLKGDQSAEAAKWATNTP